MVVVLGGGGEWGAAVTVRASDRESVFFFVPPIHFLLGGWPCEVFLFLSCDAFVGVCACLGISCFVRECLDP